MAFFNPISLRIFIYMTLHHADQMYDNPIEVAKPYASYLAMFVGMGLISGSIVHAGQAEMLKQGSRQKRDYKGR
jgi:hypothetical protein